MKYHIPILIIFILSLAFPLSGANASTQAAGIPALIEFEQIVSGLSLPVSIAHAGDGSNRLFIVLRGGRIVIHDGTQILPTPFLDITPLVNSTGGEQGLLGIAFHPNYESNGFFYINYTNKPNGDTAIVRYRVSANPNVADSTSAFPLLTIAQPYSNHNGGQLNFGPDGYLYIGMGDGGSGGDPQNYAQTPNSLLGKLLRIDVNSGSPYSIPPDNPFVSNANVADEIWAFGLRNPWRFSFDRLTGDLFIGDVGQGDWEEINFQSVSSVGGENYGWSCYEGLHAYNTGRDCSTHGILTPPALEYPQGLNNSNGCSVTGGYVYRGNKYPASNGVYFYGDFCTGKVWAAIQAGSNWTSGLVADTNFLISTFGEDESGELYVASYGDGTIYRIKLPNFADVPSSYWAKDFIERLYSANITSGCSTNPLKYCPENPVTRAEMAVFLERGMAYPSSYNPPDVTPTFGDTAGHWAEDWIEALRSDGITAGCGNNNYCPNNRVTRAQMAVFLLKAKHGSSYIPPDVGADTGFGDVPAGHWTAAWIKQLAAEGITGGCGGGNYCPEAPVTRAQMAVFLVRTFNLP